jgi:O-antigen/teichoic acid export membrane protein
MSIVIASINFATYAIQYVAYRQWIKNITIAKNFISLEIGRVLFTYCFGLSMWSFAVLLIAGLDIMLVGVFDFKAVSYYAVAASVVTFIAAVQSAAFSALLPAGAILHAHGNEKELGALLISTTRYSLWIVLIISIPFIFFARSIFTLWLGVSYPEYLLSIFRILLVANILRMSWTPYFTLLAATGQQRLVIITPFVEGLANLLFSLL